MSKYFKDPMHIDQLNEIEHWVTQENGTERPGTGEYLNNKKIGIHCLSTNYLNDKFKEGFDLATIGSDVRFFTEIVGKKLSDINYE